MVPSGDQITELCDAFVASVAKIKLVIFNRQSL